MIKLLKLGDRFVFYILESFFHRIQIWIGKTNFYFAGKVALAVSFYFAWEISRLIFSGFLSGPAEKISRFAVALVFGWFGFIWFQSSLQDWKEFEERAFSRMSANEDNPAKSEPLFIVLRWAMVIWAVYTWYRCWKGLGSVETAIFILGLTIYQWILACDPLPPCIGKIQKWITNVLRSKSAARA